MRFPEDNLEPLGDRLWQLLRFGLPLALGTFGGWAVAVTVRDKARLVCLFRTSSTSGYLCGNHAPRDMAFVVGVVVGLGINAYVGLLRRRRHVG
jgi:hypothetical protein